jgi:ATP-dependent RNA helicase RhlE
MLFEELNIIEPILKALKTEGYTAPTPIQEQSIPIILERKDLLGCAQTGTGKTAAFAIPIIQILEGGKIYDKGPRAIKCLILTPTRELAIQIGESFAAYGRHTGMKHAVIFGGVSQGSQVSALKSGIDILIATPGRLLDLINQKFVHLHYLKIFVLDEADQDAGYGFYSRCKKDHHQDPAETPDLIFLGYHAT